MAEYDSRQIMYPISTAELERRWAAARAMMAEKGLDCLIMQGITQYLSGYVRWFTDFPTLNSYPITVIFPRDGEMTLITNGAPPKPGYPPVEAMRGIKAAYAEPFFPAFNYSVLVDAEIAAGTLREEGAKVVGVLGENLFPASMYNYISKTIPGIELVEAADYIDGIKAVKSEEELAMIRKCIEIQDLGMAEVPKLLRPGMREFELRAALEHMMTDLGSEEKWIMIGSCNPGGLSHQKMHHVQNRVIEKGDEVCVMIEVNGPGGYYGEIGRQYCMSKPSAELKHIWNEAVEAQALSASMLKPGAKPSEILKANNEFLTSRGYPPEIRLYAHGQGYDLIERPALQPDETMLIQEDMNIAVHPKVIIPTGQAYCCDNYLVTKEGGVRLHKTPLELIEV